MNTTPLEREEQVAVVQYLELKGLKFTSVPNSTFTRSWKQKTSNKQQGLRAGLPDLIIALPGKLLFVEMKRQKGGTVSKDQKEWIKSLNEIDGGKKVEAMVSKGADPVIEFIEKYLSKTGLKEFVKLEVKKNGY